MITPTTIKRKIWISTKRAKELMECSDDSVLRLLECGAIDGHRRTLRGWWRVDYDSVCAYMQYLENGGSIKDWLELRRQEKEVQK
ncbi:MAG TPA: hypothetical protein VN577_20245 [Terriglobales bacterium]|nr:hypothetical protein [Terriglobales bacterium]